MHYPKKANKVVRESITLPLPKAYRVEHLLRFYARDPIPTGEGVVEGVIYKNIIHQGKPLQLRLQQQSQQLKAEQVGKTLLPSSAFQALIEHLAGFRQLHTPFNELHGEHPELGPLIRQTPWLFTPQLQPFEALTWAIIGQLISVKAAVTIRRRLIQTTHIKHLGWWTHPTPEHIVALGENTLRDIGFSASKARALLAASHAQLDNPTFLPDPTTPHCPDKINKGLQEIPGIGPWTAQYTLLRGYNHLAGDLAGDLAVRRGLGALQSGQWPPSTLPTIAATRAWLATFSPYQAMAAAHLWHWQAQHF